MIYYQKGSEHEDLSMEDLRKGLYEALDKLGERKKVLAIPPDFTRKHSFAGPLTGMADSYYGSALTDILPALGTHAPMSEREIG